MGLDRSSPMPLWAQLEHELKVRLDAGEFGERFPTDGELLRLAERLRRDVGIR